MRARFESEVGGEYDWTLEAMSKRYVPRGVTYVGDGYVTAQGSRSSSPSSKLWNEGFAQVSESQIKF